MLLRLIGFYQRWISPVLPPRCRFFPTCSSYAAEALETHGKARGSALALKRFCRCHPFHPGGFDPVPAPSSDSRNDISDAPQGFCCEAESFNPTSTKNR
ncbi:MAG: membrane protein insertion efficiency factor YidD [Granulosicoccus sp.]